MCGGRFGAQGERDRRCTAGAEHSALLCNSVMFVSAILTFSSSSKRENVKIAETTLMADGAS
jgi:hypothetical protein